MRRKRRKYPFGRTITNQQQDNTQNMKKLQVGKKVRIIGNSNEHNYTMGGVYTITHIDESDSTLKGDDVNGVTGNWIRWKDVMVVGTIGWDFIKKVLPPDVIEFLGTFDGIEQLELSGDVKDAILLSLPNLHERILEEGAKPRGVTPAPTEKKETQFDDIFGS
jgi:hypothetical protein